MGVDVMCECAHLLYADGEVRAEFNPDGADLGKWIWYRLRGKRSVFLEHCCCGFERGVHLFAVGGTKCI